MRVKIEIEADLPDEESCVTSALDVEEYFELRWDHEADVTFQIVMT